MMDTTNLQGLKLFMLQQLSDGADVRVFFDEWFLHDLKNKSEEYKEFLLEEEKALELIPLKETPYSMRALVTPSAQLPGEWQVTLFNHAGTEPQGHRSYETFEAAILDNVEEWFANGLWCWEDNGITSVKK